MKKVKKVLPNIEALNKQFETVLDSSLADFLKTTHSKREEVIGGRRFVFVGLAFTFAIIVALYAVQNVFSTQVFNGLILLMACWLLVVIVSGRRWFINDRLLAKEINMALVPALTNTLDRMVMYTHDSEHRRETVALLKQSELLVGNDISVVSDDMYTIFGEKDVTMREVLATKHFRSQGKGKDSQITVFKGLFLVTKLSKGHKAKTFISTENDKVGLEHNTFWSNLIGTSPINETVLEWNDFEKDLHVASNDAAKAREILTPELMVDLYSWWIEHKLNIRISFIDDYMYMLLPESSIKIGTSTTSSDKEAVGKYAWTLVYPMWRSLTLIEDVDR